MKSAGAGKPPAKKVYNLSIGTPDFSPAPHVMEALSQAARKPENYRYALSERARSYWKRCRTGTAAATRWSLPGMRSWPSTAPRRASPTSAGRSATPDDVVLVPDPGYPIFEMGPLLCGAKTVRYPLLPEKHYLPDLSAIDPAVAREGEDDGGLLPHEPPSRGRRPSPSTRSWWPSLRNITS